jgi:hypothetical protein
MDVYQEHGYESRRDYLRSLAEDLCLPLDTVLMAAAMLGPSEDFDGLPTMLEDHFPGACDE